MLNRRPRGPLCWVMTFFTASYQQLFWTPTHQGPFCLMWLSLPHLVYNSARSLTATPTHQGPLRPLRPDVALPTTPRLFPSPTLLQLTWLLSWLSYIIVQRPLSRLLDLWNRMFDRHQAEITVMQFTGHSLPVHQSMSVLWEFFFSSSHFISQFPPTRFPLITAIRMCHILPVHHIGMAFLAGSKVKIQHSEYHLIYSSSNLLSPNLLWLLIGFEGQF